ncbi:MAG: hypothetical protein WBB07_02930 [Mycobacterium sp.]
MTITNNIAFRRSALALSSIALTTSVLLGAAPHATADPYDDGDGTEAVAPDYGYDPAPDMGGWDQGDLATPDVTDPGDWNQGDYSAPEVEAPEVDAPDAGAPEVDAPDYSSPEVDAPALAGDAPGLPDTEQAPDPGFDGAPDTDAGQSDPGTGDAPAPQDPGPDTDAMEPMDDFDVPDITTAEAPQGDITTALAASPVAVDPGPATTQEITELTQTLESQITSTSRMTSSTWSSGVTQWNSSWVGYDTFYRPIITNPYRTPLQLVYTYGDATRIFEVPPMQRAVLSVPNPGVYSFTAVSQNGSGAPAISTGSFSGGGYVPQPGQPLPPKPKTPKTYKNVLVELKYSNGTTQPFRVKSLTDLGDDPTVGGHRVLLDEETPAWGNWSKTSKGEPMFVVTKTQQLPGLTAPAEGPLPGYDVKLASSDRADQDRSGIDPLVITAIGCGVLGLASVGFFVMTGRRRAKDGEDQH